MTQVPEAYEQAKKHILFHKYCITTKIVMLNSRMDSATICYAEVKNMYSLRTQPQYTTHHNGTYNAHWY